MVRERIARVRHERTMTVKEPKDSTALGFENMLTDKEKEGLTEEEQMKMVATKMQEKFKTEQRRTSVTVSTRHRTDKTRAWNRRGAVFIMQIIRPSRLFDPGQ